MPELLNDEEQKFLLKIARQAIEEAVNGRLLPPLVLDQYPESLRQLGASFVTITSQGELRGCIGTLEARNPLIEDVREHAIAAALEDYRFAPIRPHEIPEIRIEISCLTPPKELEYRSVDDLLEQLRPHVDGVTLREGKIRATFLPQVWKKIPEKERFLQHLCLKMGAPRDLWRKKHLNVQTYQVQEFRE